MSSENEIKRLLTDAELEEIRREIKGQAFLVLFSMVGTVLAIIGILAIFIF